MNKLKIYLCGGMTNISLKDASEWRNKVKDGLDYNHFEFFDPVEAWNVDSPLLQMSQEEAMHFDLWHLSRSDLLVVNFNDVYSVGSNFELGVAYENKIPILGIGTIDKKLHPWQEICCETIFETVEDLVDYIRFYY